MPLRAPPSLALLPRSIGTTTTITGPAASLPVIARRGMAGGASHSDHYDPPSGWLFGVPPGEKPKKEGWEGVWYWGFVGSMALAAVGWAYKPDTS